MKTFYKIIFLIVLLINFLNLHSQNVFNKLDDKGKKDGLWKGVYEESKRPRYEGTFYKGKEVGVFTFFDNTKTNKIIATREFNAKDNAAYTIFYDKNKNKVSEGKVVNKLYEGQWKYYHRASTSIMTLENYKNGKLEGLRTVFYPDGKTAEETNYKNNNKEGICKIYTQNGELIEESNYKNNSYNGVAVFSDTEGNLVSKGNFVNGKKSEIWQFYEKGKLVKETNMSFPEQKSKLK
jgi:antitoxin component YwqK of YwqJK toxin-antitoxin module